jgi:hypothetical protein
LERTIVVAVIAEVGYEVNDFDTVTRSGIEH